MVLEMTLISYHLFLCHQYKLRIWEQQWRHPVESPEISCFITPWFVPSSERSVKDNCKGCSSLSKRLHSKKKMVIYFGFIKLYRFVKLSVEPFLFSAFWNSLVLSFIYHRCKSTRFRANHATDSLKSQNLFFLCISLNIHHIEDLKQKVCILMRHIFCFVTTHFWEMWSSSIWTLYKGLVALKHLVWTPLPNVIVA
jgi:hypothetical protein